MHDPKQACTYSVIWLNQSYRTDHQLFLQHASIRWSRQNNRRSRVGKTMNLLKRKIYTITGMDDIIRICTLITIRQAHLQATVSSATFTWSPGLVLNCQCPGSCCNRVYRGDRQCSSCSSPISRLKTEHGLILKYVLEMNYCNLLWLSELLPYSKNDQWLHI